MTTMDNNDDNCGVCGAGVLDDDPGVCCDTCERWHHTGCVGINIKTYRRMQNSDEDWICRKCREPVTGKLGNNWMRKEWHHLKVGSLNCRGLKGPGGNTKRMNIAADMQEYHLDILALQETHTGGEAPEEITTSDGKNRFMIYHSSGSEKSRAGTAIAVRKGTTVTFRAISERICLVKIKINNNHVVTLINAYAPTLPVSENKPEVRESFYDDLEDVVRSTSNRDQLIVAGDFNAKTGREWKSYPENIGRYGKGEMNSNGKELLEFCHRQNLVLTNTLFKHKMSHRTTWESPATSTDKERRNPYRNQIDYIMIKTSQRHTLNDSRSHNGLMTFTDHRLVRATFNLERLKTTKEKYHPAIAVEKLQDPITRASYAFNVEMKIMDKEYTLKEEGRQPEAQEMWDMIVDANRCAAIEILGYREKRRHNNIKVQALSEKQKMINNQANSTTDDEQRRELKRSRNKVMKEIHAELTREKTDRIEKELAEIETAKDDSNRMFKAIKSMNRMKPKTPLVVEDEEGITTDEERQCEIISSFFERMFHASDAQEIEDIPPRRMTEPFTEQEVRKAVSSLKNNRSPGIDELNGEYLKNGPDIICKKIADLLNHGGPCTQSHLQFLQ